MVMFRLYTIGAGFLLILSISLYYWLDERAKNKADKKRSEALKKMAGTFPRSQRLRDGVSVPIPATCGQIRPGEWQCNCIDKPCIVLLQLKSQVEEAEDKLQMTDRRGAIAAQRARKKKNGN